MKLNRSLLTALAACSLAAALPAVHAQTARTALNFDSLGRNGFDYQQGNYCLGWRFTAQENLLVTTLGFYDALQDGLAEKHLVGLMEADTGKVVASTTVTPGDSLVGFFRFHPVAATKLVAGRDYYALAITGQEDYAVNVDSLSVDPAIKFAGFAASYQTEGSGQLAKPDAEQNLNGDFGPSFQFRLDDGTTPIPGEKVAELRVDLQVTQVKQNAAGSKWVLKGTFDLVNEGRKAAKNVQAAFYLTPSATFDPATAVLLKTVDLASYAGSGKLGKGADSGLLSYKLKVSTSLFPSLASQYLAVVVDPSNLVAEGDETNNAKTVGPLAP